MSRYKRKIPQNHSGTVYVLEIKLEGEIVYKVGVTVYSVSRRVLQIIEGMHKSYGYFPEVRILKQDKTRHHFKVEKAIHNQLDEWKYVPDFVFTGSTELFKGVDRDVLLERYALALGNDEDAEVSDRIYVY